MQNERLKVIHEICDGNTIALFRICIVNSMYTLFVLGKEIYVATASLN